MMRRGASSCLLPALVVALGLLPTAAASAVSEYEVKLALVYKLAKFVAWPPEKDAQQVFSLCVLGADPFGAALDALEERTLQGRPIGVQRRTSVSGLAERCHLVFIARQEATRVGRMIDALGSDPVLTISDAPDFARRGGIVGFRTRNSRVAFEINVAAARRAELSISSQLLQLATLVEDEEVHPP